MRLPPPRGPVTDLLWADLLTYPVEAPLESVSDAVRQALRTSGDLLYDEDLQLALFCLYELHYSGVDGVDDRWEWDPGLLRIRHLLETAFEARLRQGVAEVFDLEEALPRSTAEAAERLTAMTCQAPGTSVYDYIGREATAEQVREFLVHQSVHHGVHHLDHRMVPQPARQLRESAQAGREAPPTAGEGTVAGIDLDLDLEAGCGAYAEWFPAVALAALNTRSMFGLNRRLRGAAAGHLAVEHLTAREPQESSARALRRLGWADRTAPAESTGSGGPPCGPELATRLMEEDTSLADDLFFGAASACLLDRLCGRWQLEAWHGGRGSLRRPLPDSRQPAPARPAAVTAAGAA